jgi:serine/threonine protein kinase
MASVYRAVNGSENRQVALKVLSPHLSGVPAARDRFRREAELAMRIHDPGIVPVHSFGIDGSYHYYVMDLLDVPTLDEFIDNNLGTRGEAFFIEASRLFAGLCRSVAGLHSAGILHRDIKPTNIFLTRDSRLVLADFGVAIDMRAPRPERLGDDRRGEGRVFDILGTPPYMSPERFVQGNDCLDPRADVYSLGMSLYELVTGVLPFPECSVEEVARLKLTRKPPSPRALLAAVPLGVEAIIRQAIEIHPDLRYQTAEEMAIDLERFANHRRGSTRRHTGPLPCPGELPELDEEGGDAETSSLSI